MGNYEEYEALRIQEEDIIRNNAPRVLVAFCIDSSYSMVGDRINTVNSEMRKLLKNMSEDIFAKESAEVCLVSFGDKAEVHCEFGPVEKAYKLYRDVEANGLKTSMAAGVTKALELIDKEYDHLNGKHIYRPILVIISDGEATDKNGCEAVSAEVRKRIYERRLKVNCLFIGDDDNMASLKTFSLDGKVEKINSQKMMEFFEMLSRSVTSTSSKAIQIGDEY